MTVFKAILYSSGNISVFGVGGFSFIPDPDMHHGICDLTSGRRGQEVAALSSAYPSYLRSTNENPHAPRASAGLRYRGDGTQQQLEG